ncbi:hypothetical protein [Aeromonas veronii]|uniref:hypothetical protein n=1 Tax=Aeromonas veronii TaxID=654 RepID=UPI003BA31128
MNNKVNEKLISKELMLRDGETGRWIRRSDEELSLSDNYIPSTFIQVVENKIYYADTNFIISEMLRNRNKEKNEFLETKYNNILDCLDNTRVYSSGFDRVFNGCESSANEFDNEIRRLANGLDAYKIDAIISETLINTTKAYIKILFAYLYSALLLHKDKVKGETVIIGKINNLRSYLLDVLEAILIPSFNYGGLNYSSSIYLNFIYNKDLNINYINTLINHDRRFNNSLELVRKLNEATLSFSSKFPAISVFTGEFNALNTEHPKMKFIDELVKLLNDINRLENIRKEIGHIDDVRILEEFDVQRKKD